MSQHLGAWSAPTHVREDLPGYAVIELTERSFVLARTDKEHITFKGLRGYNVAMLYPTKEAAWEEASLEVALNLDMEQTGGTMRPSWEQR